MRHKHRNDEGKVTVSWFAPGEELPGRGGVRVPTYESEDDDFE